MGVNIMDNTFDNRVEVPLVVAEYIDSHRDVFNTSSAYDMCSNLELDRKGGYHIDVWEWVFKSAENTNKFCLAWIYGFKLNGVETFEGIPLTLGVKLVSMLEKQYDLAKAIKELKSEGSPYKHWFKDTSNVGRFVTVWVSKLGL